MNMCNVIRDLLPLYAEGILSPDSVEFTDAHLVGCPECQAELEKVRSGVIPSRLQQDRLPIVPLRKLKWKLWRRWALAAGLAAVLTAVLVFGGIQVRRQVKNYGMLSYTGSKIYTVQEILEARMAAEEYMDMLRNITGYELISFRFAGDGAGDEIMEIRNGPRTPFRRYTENIAFEYIFYIPGADPDTGAFSDEGAWYGHQLVVVARVSSEEPWQLIDSSEMPETE